MTLLAAFVVLFAPIVLVFKPKLYVFYVLVLGVVPLSSLGMMSTPIGSLSISSIKVFGILVSSGIGLLIHNKNLPYLLAKIWPFTLFFLICTVSLILSDNINMAIRMLLKLLAPFMFALYVANCIDKIGIAGLLKIIVISGIFSISIGLCAIALGLDDGHLGLPGSSRAVFSSHLMIVFSTVMAFSIVNTTTKNIIFSSIIGGSIVAAFTRITIAGMFLIAGYLLFQKLKGLAKLLMPLAAVVTLFSLFFFVDEFKERMFLNKADSISFGTVIENPDDVVGSIGGSGRFAAWEFALNHLFYPNPTFGAGLGETQYLFYGKGDEKLGAVHSEYIRLICDLGILGLSFYLLGWFKLFFVVNRKKVILDKSVEILRLSALGASIGYLVFLATDNGLDYASQLGVFVYSLLFVYLVASKKKTARKTLE